MFKNVKYPILSAIAFFGMLGMLSIGYSAYSWLSAVTPDTPLTVTLWTQVKDNFDDLNSRMSNFSFSSGKVGVGTATPNAKLHVQWDLQIGLGWAYKDLKIGTDSAMGDYVQTNFITPVTVPGSGTSKTAVFFKNAVSGAGTNRIDAIFDGNVGIGTVSPGQRLTVSGTIESTSGGVKFPDGSTQTKAFQGIMTVRTNVSTFSLSNGASTSLTATCLAGEIATGGWCQDSGYKDFYYWQPGTNYYACGWYNTSWTSRNYVNATAYVNCLK